MSNKQLTDAQLSERVCKALGIEPRREWAVGPDKDIIRIAFTSRQAAYNWKAMQPRENNLIVWELEIYPSVLDWAGFGRVVERLRELNVYVSTYVHPDTVEVEVVPVKGCYHGEDEKSLPRALALAVLEWESSR